MDLNFSELVRSLFLIFCLGVLQIVAVHSQSHLELSLRFDAFALPLNSKSLTNERGIGYYEVDGKAEVNQGIYLDLCWWMVNNIGLSVGGGIHSYNYQVNYLITNPIAENTILFDSYRVFQTLAWGPDMFVNIEHDRWRARLGGFLVFDRFRTESSSEPFTHTSFFFDPMDQISAALIIKESSFLSPFTSAYTLCQLGIQYQLNKNIYINAGFETTLGQKRDIHYNLRITGNTESTTDETHELNNFSIRTKYQAITIGLSYSVPLQQLKDE